MTVRSSAAGPGARARRIYQAPAPDDGRRVLVDRLWPRGVSREAARLDAWLKDIAPSHELRRWFHGPQGTREEFRRRYQAELSAPDAARALDGLRDLAAAEPVTLLTAATEPEHGHVAVLLALLPVRGA